MNAKRSFLAAGFFALLLTVGSFGRANAQVSDAANDFIPSYTGPHNGDLDVLTANVTYDSNNNTFTFATKLNGTVGTTPTGLYVWGLDRGVGNHPFAVAPGVGFDSIVLFTANGAGSVVRDLTNGKVTPISLSSISINGDTLTSTISASLLPSQGKTLDAYTFNLWPRSQSSGGVAKISDFAPDNSNFGVAVTPEPGTVAFLLAGFGAGIFSLRRKKAGY